MSDGVAERLEDGPAAAELLAERLPNERPKSWPRWVEDIVGSRERNVVPYRAAIKRLREYLLIQCRSKGIDLARFGVLSDNKVRRIVQARVDAASSIPRGEQLLLCDDGTWATETLGGRPIVQFPAPGAAFTWTPPDDEAALSELERVHRAGVRYVVLAADSLWWLECYLGFAAYLHRHGERVLRTDEVAVFRLPPPSGGTTSWKPIRRRDIARRRVARLAQALYATPALHRLVPDRAALTLAALYGRASWLDPRTRARARARSRVILRGTGLEHRESEVAKRQLVEVALEKEIFMRPWGLDRDWPIEGFEHLEQALGTGRGVVLVSAHIGIMPVAIWAVTARGVSLNLIAGSWGQDNEQARSVFSANADREAGLRYIHRGGSFQRIRELLARGEVCGISLDLPGSAKTTYLHKPAHVASGPANLAMLSGALIVVGWADRRGLRPFAKAMPAIDPADFTSAEQLTDHLAAVFTEELMRRPEALSPDPTLLGVWGESASVEEWAFHPRADAAPSGWRPAA